MPSVDEGIRSELPQFYSDNEDSNLTKVLRAIAYELDCANDNVDAINNMDNINDTNGDDLYNRWGALLSVPRMVGEDDESYRTRLKLTVTSLSGGTVGALKYAIAVGLGINNSQTLIDKNVHIYDAWEPYNGEVIDTLSGRSIQSILSEDSVARITKIDGNTDINTDVYGTNLVTNGDFSNGITGWYGSNSTISVANNTMTSTGNGGAAACVTYQALTSKKVTQKLYVRIKMRVTNSVCNNLGFSIGGGGHTLKSHPTANEWYTMSAIHTMPNDNAVVYFDPYHEYTDATTANGKIMEVKNVLILDLTAIFGAGNEPTVEQINAILSKFINSWFDGKQLLFKSQQQIRPDNYLDYYGTNILINSDFSNGVTGWIGSGATISASDGVASLLPVWQYCGIQQTITNYEKYRGHKLYFAAMVKADSTSIMLVLNDASNQGMASVSNIVDYALLSNIYTISPMATKLYLRLQDNRASGWTTSYIKDVVMLDLTAIFGLGNEPTVAEVDVMMNKFINNWFSGKQLLRSDYSLDKIATNLIINGNFNNGSANWTTVASTFSIVDGRAKILASSQYGRLQQNITVIPGHKYYLSATIEGNGNQYLILQFTGNYTVYQATSGVSRVSGIVTPTDANVIMQLGDLTTSGFTYYYIDNAMLLDLTAIFGSGNEPTVAQMDAIMDKFINRWFDGTASLLRSQTIDIFGDNLITNGEFLSTAGWSSVTSLTTLSVVNKELSSTTTTANSNNGVCGETLASIIGHKYYFAFEMKPFRTHQVRIHHNPNTIVLPNTATAGVFNRISTIITAMATYNTVNIYDNGVSTTDMIVGSVTKYRNIMWLDLTAIFGVGNEPTASQVDAILSRYPNSWFNSKVLLSQKLLPSRQGYGYNSPSNPSAILNPSNFNVISATSAFTSNSKLNIVRDLIRLSSTVYNSIERKSDGKLYHIQRVGKIIFNGTEFIDLIVNNNPRYVSIIYYKVDIPSSNIPDNTYGLPFLCSHAIYSNGGQSDYHNRSGNMIYGYDGTSVSMIITFDTSAIGGANTLALFKTWLTNQYNTGTPLTLYYQLLTPIETLIDDLLLTTYNNITNIMTDAVPQVPMTLEFMNMDYGVMSELDNQYKVPGNIVCVIDLDNNAYENNVEAIVLKAIEDVKAAGINTHVTFYNYRGNYYIVLDDMIYSMLDALEYNKIGEI